MSFLVTQKVTIATGDLIENTVNFSLQGQYNEIQTWLRSVWNLSVWPLHYVIPRS